MASSLIRGEAAFAGWKAELLSGRKPVRWALAPEDSPLRAITAGPGMVSLWGGQPGVGKTALLLQLLVDGLRLQDELRVLIANVEMTEAALFDRQLARLSGIDLPTVQSREFGPQHQARLAAGLQELESVIQRVAFCGPPYSIEAVAESADEFEPNVVCLDYLQRFTAGTDAGDKRTGVTQLMAYVRGFADAGACVFVVSALARQKNAQGRSGYDAEALTLAAFRDSSELEYGTDAAYILTTGKEPHERRLLNLKNRNEEPKNLDLEFAGAVQRFGGTFIDDITQGAERWWTE